MIMLVQIPVQCPKDGYFMFKLTRETYDIDNKSVTKNTDSYVCQKCEPSRYYEILKRASKITMLKKEDIRDRR